MVYGYDFNIPKYCLNIRNRMETFENNIMCINLENMGIGNLDIPGKDGRRTIPKIRLINS